MAKTKFHIFSDLHGLFIGGLILDFLDHQAWTVYRNNIIWEYHGTVIPLKNTQEMYHNVYYGILGSILEYHVNSVVFFKLPLY